MDNTKRLMRVPDRWVGGVCGGLAEYFELPKDVVRIVWLLLTFLTVAFPGVVMYIILWVLVPKKNAYL